LRENNMTKRVDLSNLAARADTSLFRTHLPGSLVLGHKDEERFEFMAEELRLWKAKTKDGQL
jgi:hypothetical protein